MVNFFDFFNLSDNFSKKELKKCYLAKLDYISKLDIPKIDKTFFIEQAYKMVNFFDFFNLSDNFSKEELKKCYLAKLDYISKLDIPKIDKTFFIEQAHKLYKQAKHYDYQKKYGIMSIYEPSSLLSFHDNYFDKLNKSLLDRFDKLEKDKDKFKDAKAYSRYVSYSEHLNDDGSKTVVETTKTIKDGIENKQTNTYKKYPDGRIEKIVPMIKE